MRKNPYLLNVILSAVSFAALAVMHLTRVFYPAVILPKLDLPALALVTLAALLLTDLLARPEECAPFPPGSVGTSLVCVALAAVTFALLPLMAGFSCVHTFWKLGLAGGAVFAVCGFVFASAAERISTGPRGKTALVMTALGIFLAFQCFSGMLL